MRGVERCAFVLVEGREDRAHVALPQGESAQAQGEADAAAQGRRNTVEVVAALALITRLSSGTVASLSSSTVTSLSSGTVASLSSGTNGAAAQWQQELQQVLLQPHCLARPRRVLLLVPTEAQQQAAAKAWGRLQRQQGRQQGGQHGLGQQGGGQGRQQEATTGAASGVVVGVEVVGSRQWDPSHPAAFDLALLTAVCAPPTSPPSTHAVHSLWPPARIRAALAAPARALLILGHACTLSAGSDTWRHVIGGARAQGRFLDLEQCDAAMGRAIRARRAAVDDMRYMLQHARGEGRVAGEGSGSHGSMHWHDLPWTPYLPHSCIPVPLLPLSLLIPFLFPPPHRLPLPCRQGLFSPEFGEALQRQQSVEVVLLLWRILQGRHGRRDAKGVACWVEGRGQQQQDEVSRVLDDIVHVDVVGDVCLIWSTDVCHDRHKQAESLSIMPPLSFSLPFPCKQVVRLWALVPESQCQQRLHRICMHLTSYSPAYLHYCALHQYQPSPPFLRVPAVVQQPSVLWFKPPSGGTWHIPYPMRSAPVHTKAAAAAAAQVDVVTPPKFIVLQPAMALSLLGEGGGAAACALSSVPFEVNAEESAAILCPSSLVVHGRSDLKEDGVGGVGGRVGSRVGAMRQVVVTRSLQLCAAIQTEITHAARSVCLTASLHASSCSYCPPHITLLLSSHPCHVTTTRALSALDAIQPASALPEATQQHASPGPSASSSNSRSSSSSGALLMREDLERALMGGLPTCIAAIPPTAFPLALTLSKLLRLLDASVTHPFLLSTRRRRKREAARRRLVLAVAMSGQGLREAVGGGGDGGGRGEGVWRRRGGRRIAAVPGEEGHEERVRAGRCEREWGAWVRKRDVLQAIRSPLGHVGEEEYVRGMVGSTRALSAMGERQRRAVSCIFQAYERKKKQRKEYDSGDPRGVSASGDSQECERAESPGGLWRPSH
ncbi:unnamed protein product [Closterium sp. NIES-65]|nr:unnamed protein product [Closterium sp. NIES-65]